MKVLRTGSLFLFLLLLTLTGCKDEAEFPSFTPDELAWMPYQIGDTLIFKDKSNLSEVSIHVYKYQPEQHVDKKFQKKGETYMSGICARLETLKGFKYYFEFPYLIEKTDQDFYVVLGASTLDEVFSEKERMYNLFDLRGSVRFSQMDVAGKTLTDVYEYTTYDNREFKKMYIKKGMGIVKFISYEDQVFELVAHHKK